MQLIDNQIIINCNNWAKMGLYLLVWPNGSIFGKNNKSMKRFILIICLCCIAFIIACTQEKSAPIENDLSENSDELRVVSVEDALQHLYQFLSETQMTKTVSGEDRTISSITPHYSDKPLTKSGDSIPDAYLVNFADESGFALLGANSSIAPIIAVIETGSTDWDKLLPD